MEEEYDRFRRLTFSHDSHPLLRLFAPSLTNSLVLLSPRSLEYLQTRVRQKDVTPSLARSTGRQSKLCWRRDVAAL